MDLIQLPRVERMRLRRGGDEYIGTLHLTTHHLIFSATAKIDSTSGETISSSDLELWLGYPLIHSAELQRPPKLGSRRDGSVYERSELMAWALQGAIRIRCHHFLFVTLRCADVRKLYDSFSTIKQLACVASLEKLYAFDYRPQSANSSNGWGIYSAREEFERMGVGAGADSEGIGRFWRLSAANDKFQLCATYPDELAVPLRISDTTLTYAARYRSKGRLPVLSYLHANGASMTRSSQPMVGLKQARSVQDEKLVEAVIASAEPQGVTPRLGSGSSSERSNIIIDARPTTNAVVNRAVGAGSENMDHYKRCRKVYLGIDNIHVMRDALNKLTDAVAAESTCAADRGVVARIQSSRSNWLRHIENIMVGVRTIVQAIDASQHVLVHCSDGWDRTAQLTSLAQLCLDPYYRTARGFAVLVEKEWVSFGHQFTLRCGHLGHPDRFKITRASFAQRPAKTGAESESDTESDETPEEPVADTTTSGSASSNSPANVAAAPVDTYEFLQSSTSMFGRFASRAFKGVQSRISSAIQAASDNLDDIDDPDPFYTEYPHLQPNYVPPASDTAHHRASSGFRLGRSKHDHETSPVFQQFLDCVFQLWVQHPTMFEFNERFLLDLFYHLHSAQFGTFIGNNTRERQTLKFKERTQSVWSWVFRHECWEGSEYANPLYMADGAVDYTKVIAPDPAFLQYWSAMFSCHDPAFKRGAGDNDDSDDESDEKDEDIEAATALKADDDDHDHKDESGVSLINDRMTLSRISEPGLASALEEEEQPLSKLQPKLEPEPESQQESIPSELESEHTPKPPALPHTNKSVDAPRALAGSSSFENVWV
ncbi:phosphatidylinositol-3-phosphatase ymr1 [Kickxella alabastrina]|uniref:Phosphatidylinositol-3-phosphatase ymr1 n=1 Tax=Kickxella alabastrina TaxID=61397 RepID=A0ACC1IKW5_9FUNG|nr:phosphatidylinositol-3-phosphatase ymr1 [Kickxella alabastrina]